MSKPVEIEVFTRTDCPLCDEAIETVRSVVESTQNDVSVTLVDVDDHPELREAYGDRVPYVRVDGTPKFKYHVNAAELRDLLT